MLVQGYQGFTIIIFHKAKTIECSQVKIATFIEGFSSNNDLGVLDQEGRGSQEKN